MQAKSASNVVGIDVSHWQGGINWNAVAADGIRYTFIKATDGTRKVDERFMENAAGAVKAGLQVGFYHYAHPELNDPMKEAAHFAATVKGCAGCLPLVLDVEGEAAKVGREALTKWCVAFLQELERLSGCPAMLYTGGSFARSYLGQELRKWPLWIAHYGANKPMSNGTWEKWSVFQYTSSGRVRGITGHVDMNVMEKELFDRFAGAADPEQGEGMKMDPKDANKIIPFLQAAYNATEDKEAKAEFNRLANEVRKAAGLPTT